MYQIRNFKRTIRDFASFVNYFLWPEVCLNCDQLSDEGSGGLCSECWDDLLNATSDDYCPSCGLDVSRYAVVGGKCPKCPEREHVFDSIIRSGMYMGALREIIIKFKLADKQEFLPLLSDLASAAFEGSTLRDEVDLFVPVPIHWTRRLRRGYNQSALLAKRIKADGVSVSNCLKRIRKTHIQPGLSTNKRRQNVSGAFKVSANADIEGKTICIVDDIKTSGATLDECARVLKDAGAEKVIGLVVAVAGQGKD